MKKFCNLLFGSIAVFVIACGDDSTSAFGALFENQSSSSWIVTTSSSSWQARSSSSRNDEKSSSSTRKGISSSSQDVILSSSEGSRSSSSLIASSSLSSRNDVKSSSSIRNDVSSSSSVTVSSSSEILTDPSKIFDIRMPRDSVYTCEMSWDYESMKVPLSQHDVICTYDYNGEQGFLYVQLTPTSCDRGMSLTPGSFDVDKVQFYVNGKFADVSNVNYEWGSNHHVEHLQFTYKGNIFRYAQSTMGWGGRPCQNMDCLKVFESDGKTYVENGCNERSLPIVCRVVSKKGQVADFTDNYEICEGDPRTLGYDVEY